MEDEDETVPLLPNAQRPFGGPQTRYRWVIITLFSSLGFLQMAVWSTWAPISVSATKTIGFTPHDYDMLVNWLPISVMATTPFLIWMINKKGARVPMVISSVLVATGSGLRCLPLSGRWKKYIIHIGQILNAMAGSTTLSTSPLISNTWFPPQERVLATSCMISIGNLGNAASFIIGPTIISLPNNCSGRSPNSTTGHCVNNNKTIRKQIDHYLYGEFGISILICLLTVLFFRNKPKVSPSASAAFQRLDTKAGLRNLSKQYSWWAACIAFCVVNAAIFGWSGVITVILTPHGIPEKTADDAGLIVTCSGAVMAIIAGWLSDRMKGRVKWILIACYIGMFFSFLYMVTIVMKWISFSPFQYTEGGFWASISVFGTLGVVTLPLGVERLVDMAYPVSEGTSTSVISWASMIFMFSYLLVLNAVKNQDLANYLLLAIIAVSTPVMALSLTNQNTRLDIDKHEEDMSNHDHEQRNDIAASRVKTELSHYDQPVV